MSIAPLRHQDDLKTRSRIVLVRNGNAIPQHDSSCIDRPLLATCPAGCKTFIRHSGQVVVDMSAWHSTVIVGRGLDGSTVGIGVPALAKAVRVAQGMNHHLTL